MFRRQASLLLLLSFSSFFFATLGQVGLPGGLSSVQLPLTDERTIKAVNFGVSEISRLSMSDNHLRAYKIIEVKQQVVAGQLYHVKAYLQQTTCKKSEVK